MESLCMLENIQREYNRFASQLSLNSFECSLHREPEVYFLRGCPRRDVPVELGDGLDFFDPGVDVRL